MTVSLYRKILFAVLALLYMIPYLQGVAMAVVANDIMADMELSPRAMGLLSSSFLYAYALGSAPK